jgi:formate hydrogenlyase transcriptional activator
MENRNAAKQYKKEELLLLLEITELITQVKNQNQLLRLIHDKIKPIFNFHDIGLFVFNRENTKLSDWAAIIPELVDSEWNVLLEHHSTDLDYQNSPLEFAMKEIDNNGVTLFDYRELVQQFPDFPQWNFEVVSIMSLGYIDCLGTNLKIGGKTIGFFCINALSKNFFKPSQFSFFKAISDAIAIAIANILANEEILRREKEKLTLLEITETVAKVKNTYDLIKLIIDKVKPIFNFTECGIFVISKDGTKHTDLAAAIPELIGGIWNPKLKELPFEIPHKNSPLEMMIKEIEMVKKPVLFDFKDLFDQYPDYAQFQVPDLDILEIGFRDCLATTIKRNGEVIGMFCINALSKNFFPEHKYNIFQSIGNIISIGISNILANEEIEKLNKELQEQNSYLTEEVQESYNFGDMIGQNELFKEVCKNISLVAKTDSTVLILGETGTGKELVARAIHNNSNRKSKPLIKLNCAALPANLIESELFGHERGAFTGAIERRIGKFELANGSTLFLDEIGELPLELQSKLLRALQEREIERLGSNKTLNIDVRIIAATNRDLTSDIASGKFRSDLFYRLNIFPITLPSLRTRKEDIPLLATHFLQKYTRKIGKNIQGFSTNALQEMMVYKWLGNIRELEHTIERAVILSNSKLIQSLCLPLSDSQKLTIAPKQFEIKTWEEQERDYLLEILKLTNGKITGKRGAAQLLDLKPTTLQSKILKLGIKRQHYVEL